MTSLDAFFEGRPTSWRIFEALQDEIFLLGAVQIKVTKSQIAFRRRKAFAWAWIPGKYLRGTTALLVLTFSFPFRDKSGRWKEIVEPRPGRFTHHLALSAAEEIDDEVRNWLLSAWKGAG